MVLKSGIRALALPRQQRSHLGLRVNQDVHFSLLTHTKQLLFVTFCDRTTGIGASFWSNTHNCKKDGQKDVEVDTVIQMLFLYKTLNTHG